MKKYLILLAALFAAVIANAQTDVDMEKLFGVQDKFIELNEPMTIKEGIIFIGDTRDAQNIQDGKYQGMRVQKQRRHFKIDGKVRQYVNSLMFRRAPRGSMKDHVMQLNRVPRSCMVQIKPLGNGKLTFCGQTSKDEAHLYVAVRNGVDYKVMATLPYAKTEKTGKKDDPYTTVSCDYEWAEGDELWIFADTNINLFGFTFSGKIDAGFLGSDPVSVEKAVRKAQQ